MQRRLNRRQALGGFGSLSLGAVLAAYGGGSDGGTTQTPTGEFDDAASCEATAELRGSYYFDADAIRSDIREDRPGIALRLGIRVRSAGQWTPMKDAVVDIWGDCDAGGVYSAARPARASASCAGPRLPMPTASQSSPRSTQAGTGGR